MKKNRRILDWLADNTDLPGEAIPGQSIVEIAADRRVLIENHKGVVQYSGTRIGVKVSFGQIVVCGCGLELVHMSGEQVVISGRIDEITLVRREGA